jgi:hypothetical protein
VDGFVVVDGMTLNRVIAGNKKIKWKNFRLTGAKKSPWSDHGIYR